MEVIPCHKKLEGQPRIVLNSERWGIPAGTEMRIVSTISEYEYYIAAAKFGDQVVECLLHERWFDYLEEE